MIEWRWQLASGCTCGWNSHTGSCSQRTHTHTRIFHLLSHARTQSASNFPTAILDFLSPCQDDWHSLALVLLTPHVAEKALTASESDRWGGSRRLIMRGKWKCLQEGLILTCRGRRPRRATCGIKGGLPGHLSGANKQAESLKSFQFNQATLGVCRFEEGLKKKEKKSKLILQQL